MLRDAATAQLTAATNAASPSPMSSTSIVVWSLTQWNAVQPLNSSEATAATVAAIANGHHPWMPRPVTTIGLRRGMAAAGFCTKRAYAGVLNSEPGLAKVLGAC